MKLLWLLVIILLLSCESNDLKRDPGLIYDLRGYIRPDSIKYPVGKTITVQYWLTNVTKKDIDEQIVIGSKKATQPFRGYNFNASSTGEKTTPLELKEAGNPYNGKLSLKPKEEKVFVENKFVATRPGSYLLSFRLHWRNSKRIPFKPVTIYITEEKVAKSTLSPEIEKALAALTSKDNIERGKAGEVILVHSDITASLVLGDVLELL